MITTVLFDMDGLLLDTEPLWGISMWAVAQVHRIPITPDRFRETTGLRIDEVTRQWARHFPWEGASPEQVADDIIDDVILRSKREGRILPGVEKLLEALGERGVTIGLASSSTRRMIDALVTHFGLYHLFHAVTSGDEVERAKPHPEIFLKCAVALGAQDYETAVLEDSLNGCIAGKAARMKVVAVPDAQHFEDPRFAIADLRVRSLEQLDVDMLLRL
jgi:sugar-phosphatase